MQTGWVKFHRKIIDSRVFARAELLKLWCLCLALANHTDKWVDVNGVISPVRVKRGQFITGRFSLHDLYYPKKSDSNKNPRTVWRWLKELEKWQNLTMETSKRFTLVTICNYGIYQGEAGGDVQANVPLVSHRCPTDVQPVSTTKNDKNEENEKNEKKDASCPEPPQADGPGPPALTEFVFPVVDKDVDTWTLPAAKLAEYKSTYSHLDVEFAIGEALQWIRDNPANRKTPQGMTRYLGGWLKRSQNSRHGARSRRGAIGDDTRPTEPI